MKVVHFCTHSSGGAAIAACRLHQLLLEQGVDSTMVFLYSNRSQVPGSVDFRDSLPAGTRLVQKVRNKLLMTAQKRKLSAVGTVPEFFSFPFSVWDIAAHPLVKTADIIHFHWMGNFLDFRSLQHTFLKNKKIFWTLHDMNPFSGGFHYDDWFDARPWNSIGTANSEIKKKLVQGLDLRILAPSRWILERSLKSGLFADKQHNLLHNPSSDKFFFINKKEARRNLGIRDNERLCFIPGDHTNYLRKGIVQLEEHLRQKKYSVKFLTTGERPLRIGANEQHFIGKVMEEERMAWCYNAADITALPSLSENYSNSLVESMLCGCPVVCFDVGGNAEIVNLENAGSLVAPYEWNDFLQAGSTITLQEEQRSFLSSAASAVHRPGEIIDKLITLYKD